MRDRCGFYVALAAHICNWLIIFAAILVSHFTHSLWSCLLVLLEVPMLVVYNKLLDRVYRS